jgi:hypothetical protein
MSHCNEMLCQQVTLSGYAEWPKVADAVIEALKAMSVPSASALVPLTLVCGTPFHAL